MEIKCCLQCQATGEKKFLILATFPFVVIVFFLTSLSRSPPLLIQRGLWIKMDYLDYFSSEWITFLAKFLGVLMMKSFCRFDDEISKMTNFN